MKKIVSIRPLRRDKKELPLLKTACKILFQDDYIDPALDFPTQIEQLDAFIKKEKIDGLISTNDYIGTLVKAIVAERNNLPAPDPRVIAHQQHKYYARLQHKALVPEATPAFALVTDAHKAPLPYPFFIKPVRGNFSHGSQEVHTDAHWHKAYKDASYTTFDPWFDIAKHYIDPTESRVLAEQLCSGLQCTVEGFAYNNEITIFGIVDSIMFENTIAFKRFDYPSALPTKVQQRMSAIVSRLMRGIGFNNGCFNVECFYNPDSGAIHIIEVNPRLASQFVDLYEKVDGFNSFLPLIDIAHGKKPTIPYRQGQHAAASSCVLRTFSDATAVRMPSENDIAAALTAYPDAHIELDVIQGQKLSDIRQDSVSYRYGLIHVGGNDIQEIEKKSADIQNILSIILEH